MGSTISFPSFGGLVFTNGYYDMPLGATHRHFTTLGAPIDSAPIQIANTIAAGPISGQRVSYRAGSPRALLTFLDGSSSVVASLVGSDGQPLKEDVLVSSSAALVSNHQTQLKAATNNAGMTIAIWNDTSQLNPLSPLRKQSLSTFG